MQISPASPLRRARNTERGEPKLSAKVGQPRKDGKGKRHDSCKKSTCLQVLHEGEPEVSGVTVPLRLIRREDGHQRRRGDQNRCKSFQIKPSVTRRDGLEQCELSGELNGFDARTVSPALSGCARRERRWSQRFCNYNNAFPLLHTLQ